MTDPTSSRLASQTVPPRTPRRRAKPLPESSPKPAIDDPAAPARVRRLLESPAYLRADNDPELLQRDELRGTRLALEYLKTELALRDHRIESTIVLFGGTRLVEPAAARREVARLRTEVARQPHNADLQRKLRIAKRILVNSKYYDIAREFARIVSEACKTEAPSEFVIMTGGGPGIMEAGNRGAADAGRKTIGLNITLPMEQFPNPYITPELCLQFRYFGLRKLHFMMRAKALVVFPGGYGTLDELFDALCLAQTCKIDPIPIILVGEEFWRRAFNADFLVEEGVISPEDTDIFCFAETAEQIWAYITDWYGLSAQRDEESALSLLRSS